MKTFNYEGIEFHLASNEAEWKREIRKRTDYYETTWYYHHIQGRIGILRLLVENGVLLNEWWHGKEKSLDSKDRYALGKYIEHSITKTLYKVLMKIRDHYKYIDATGRKFQDLLDKGEKK